MAQSSGAERPVILKSKVSGKDVRRVDIYEDDDRGKTRIATWVRQAAALPGWLP